MEFEKDFCWGYENITNPETLYFVNNPFVIPQKNILFDAVVISGGASKGVMSLGTLYYYYEQKHFNMDHTKVYGATSIGAIICLLLVSGYTPMEIFLKMKIAITPYTSEEFGEVWEVFKHMGFMSGETLLKMISSLVKDKFGDIPTLKQLYELTGKFLIVTGSNANKKLCEYYTPTTYPDMSCIEAIKFSCRLPLLFSKIDRDGDDIVDGGLTDNFPERYVDEVCQSMFGNKKYNILGIATKATSEHSLNSFGDIKEKDSYFFNKTMVGYLYKLVATVLSSNMNLRLKVIGKQTTLIVIETNKNFEFLNPTKLQKENMFLIGYEYAEYKNTTKKIYFPEWNKFLLLHQK